MKDYYEILEVNPRASREVIEKAYRVLAKKYHPDIYSGEKQQYAQKKLQEINEAYRVLSDEFLKEQYDNELEKQKMYQKQQEQAERKVRVNQIEQEKKPVKEQKTTKKQVGTLGSIIDLTKELGNNLKQSQDSKRKKKKITQQDVLAVILTIIVVFIIGVILWFIPFTNGWMRELLFENPIANWIGGN